MVDADTISPARTSIAFENKTDQNDLREVFTQLSLRNSKRHPSGFL